VRRKFDALLGEPGDVPQIAVFDAVLANAIAMTLSARISSRLCA
jgi:hypothetical protein